jgi:DNA-directed RNA polymerase beta' subunit
LCTKGLNKENLVKKNPPSFYKIFCSKWQQQRIDKIRDQAIKRIRILENLVGTGSSPAWMILTILPVIPPALRPMIQLRRWKICNFRFK